MKKSLLVTLKLFSFSSSLLVQIALAAAAFVIIFGASYILGHSYLSGDSLMGNDTFSFFTIVHWLDNYYPTVPFWFPLQGGGVSFTGYPWFAAYLVNLISHTTSLDLVQSFRLLGFLSVPLTGVGIFVFCWARLTEVKPVWLRQVLGLLAALFYVMAPVSWIWLTQWGFYAEQVSLIFVPWIFLFFDLFMERLFANKKGLLYRIGFVGALLSLVLGFLTHFFVGVTSMVVFMMLVLVRFIFQKEKKFALAKRIFVPLLLFVIAFGCLFAFRYYSYSHYTKAVAEGGLGGSPNASNNKEGTALSLLTPQMMLSLEGNSEGTIKNPRELIVNMRFPFYVWLLLIPSLIFGVFKSKKIFAFSLFAITGFVTNTNVDVYVFFSDIPIISQIPILNQLPNTFLGRLFFVPGRILIPICAAFGAYVMWELLWMGIMHFGKKVKTVHMVLLPIKAITVCILTLLTVGVLFSHYYNLPFDTHRLNAGSLKLDLRDIWGQTERPNAILTKDYKDRQDKQTAASPEYKKIADYVYLDYLCTYDLDRPGEKTMKVYPDAHICSYFQLRGEPPRYSLIPPLAQLQDSQRHCEQLTPTQKKDDDLYCRAFYASSINSALQLRNWPPFVISSSIAGEVEGAKKFFEPLGDNGNYRYDISGFAARTIQSTPLVNNNSQIQIYINSLSLIYNAWNYQSQIMYSVYPLYQTPGVLTELGKWFGLKYVYLAGTPLEPQQYWKTDPNWTQVQRKVTKIINNKQVEVETDEGWRKFQNPLGETSWDTRPKMLVISDNSKQFYDQTFRFLTRGGATYDQIIPVFGKREVDSYSLNDLKQYDVIFMRGYGYKFTWNAHRLLDAYVKDGGNLIFDTGWQYYVPDYQITNAPAFMPFDGLVWESPDANASYAVENDTILYDIDTTKLGDMKYGDGPWGFSMPTKVRAWAKPLLTFDNKPIIVAGDYQKGKVAWIGYNIIPHQETKNSLEEILLFNRLITYMTDFKTPATTHQVETTHITPDTIQMDLKQDVTTPSNIFFRQAYYPDWHATLVSGNSRTSLSVQKAGPGFMLVSLPPVRAGDTLVFEIKPSFGQIVATVVSLIAFISLLIYLFVPSIFGSVYAFIKTKLASAKVVHHVRHKIGRTVKERVKKVDVLKSDEDDY